MANSDIVTNTSPFGSRQVVDKQDPHSTPNLVEKPPEPHSALKKQLNKAKRLLVILVVGAGGILLGLVGWQALAPMFTANPVSQSSPATPSMPDGQTAASPSLFENPLEGTRHFLAIGLVALLFVFGFSFLTIAIKKGLEAIGRNPLAARHVKQGLILTSLVAVVVVGAGLTIAYLLFYGNPPSTHSRIVVPTPAPSLPEGTETTVFTTNCLTVSVPFQTAYPKLALKDDRCTLHFSVTKPPGSFTLTYRSKPEHPFDQDPSVTMRRVYLDKYTEFALTHPRFPQILAFKTDTEQTYFLRDPDNHHFELSFHSFQAGYEATITPEIIYVLLDSIKLPQVPREDTLSVNGSLDP